MRRALARLMPESLTNRVFALYGLTLFLFVGVGLTLFLKHQYQQQVEDTQQALSLIHISEPTRPY